MRISTKLAVAITCLGCLACTSDPPPPRAGSPADFPAEGIPLQTIDSVPDVEVGREPPSDEYVFQFVLAGGLVGDSLIVVADGVLGRIGVWGLDGRFRRWVVRRGQGPAEARNLQNAGVLPNGTIWMHDAGNGHRLTALDVDGNIHSEARIRGIPVERLLDVEVVGPTEDGAWWYRIEEPVEPGTPGEAFRVPTRIWWLPPEGPATVVWEGLGEERVWGGTRVVGADGESEPEVGAMSAGLLPAFYVEPFGESVLMAWSDSSFVDRLDPDGSVTRVASFEARRMPAPQREPNEEAPPGVQAAARRQAFYPEVARIHVDPDRRVWLGQHAEAPDGTPLFAFYRMGNGRPDLALTGPGLGRQPFIGRGRLFMSRLDHERQEFFISVHSFGPAASPG